MSSKVDQVLVTRLDGVLDAKAQANSNDKAALKKYDEARG
tara:strand:- start:2959 stop:3078 length:120 start_codon:yes stop_codon:yes gene_type:complete